MILKYLYLYFFTLFFSITSFAFKGRLLAVGGGSEQTNGWSKPAYQWAVDNSANKRVAIIGVDVADPWLRDYFKNDLGAIFSKDFNISSRTMADSQEIYDSILTYDVIFFRGGDQSIYYLNFKNTKFFNAVDSVFKRGGVIAGTSAGLHILSGIVYTAQTPNSVTPEDALVNINSSDFTLKNDFFQFLPGYIFDSHVAERGRFPRTISFLARWQFDKNQKIKAIAVDDLTAIAIDTNEVGLVFGTGAAAIYENIAQNNSFQKDNNGLFYGDSIKVNQLINGWKYDFKRNLIIKPTTGGVNVSSPKTFDIQQNNIYLTSNESKLLIKDFVADFSNLGSLNDRIVIVCDGASANVISLRDELTAKGVKKINIILNNSADTNNLKYISNSYKFIFINNSYSKLLTFFKNDSIGVKLYNQINKKGTSLAFLGDNARFAGSRILSDNYKGRYTAYDNLISTTKGLGFLSNTIIYPDALISADTKENSVCAVPYFMMKDSLKYGVLLNADNYLQYSLSENGDARLIGGGRSSVLLFQNLTSPFSPSNTTSKNNGTQLPRQVMGFDSMYVSLISKYNSKIIGKNKQLALPDTISLPEMVTSNYEDLNISDFELYPNPSQGIITLKSKTTTQITFYNLLGVEILKKDIENDITYLDLSIYKNQVLIIEIKSPHGVVKKKLIIH